MIEVRPAEPRDVADIVRLANAAYREIGGWTTEAGLVFGPRVAPADLAADFAHPKKALFCALAAEAVVGCVRVEIARFTAHLGLLAVRPDLQAGGFGRALLAEAEAHGAAGGATTAELSVISVRRELIAWYQRRGYQETGESAPFVYDQLPPGFDQTPGLEFTILRKRLP